MALKLKTKKKQTKTTKAKDVNAIDQAVKLLPEACALKAELAVIAAQAKAITDKLSPIETEIKELIEPVTGDEESVTLTDGKHVLSISGKKKLRKIKDVEEAVDALEEHKEGLAIEVAKFNLGDLEKYLSPEEIKELVEIEYGARSLKYG